MNFERTLAFTDGAASGNPGPGAACENGRACGSLGASVLARGDTETALGAFVRQAEFVGDEQEQDLSVRAQVYDSLADVWLARKDFIRARSWARLALRYNTRDARARAAMTKIEAGLRGFQWPTSVSGLYVR